MRTVMNILCILAFIGFMFSEPTKFTQLIWIFIAFINVNTDYVS